jgi:hypothetical protein
MDIWQRGTSFTNVGSGGPPTYTADRWFGYRGGFAAGLSVSQQTGFSGFRYCSRVQRANADTSTQSLQFCHIIEDVNLYDLENQQFTISFYARRASSGYSGGGLLAQVVTGTTANQGSNAFANGTWSGSATAATSTVTLTSTATKFTLTGTFGASIAELTIQFLWTPTGTAGSTDYIEITGVQLEPGSVATPFERRSYGAELALCQRYFEKSYDIGIAPGASTSTGFLANGGFYAGATASYGIRVGTQYKVNKRATPTVTTYDGVGGSGKCNYPDTTTGTTMTVVANGESGFTSETAQVSSSQTRCYWHYTSSAEL